MFAIKMMVDNFAACCCSDYIAVSIAASIAPVDGVAVRASALIGVHFGRPWGLFPQVES